MATRPGREREIEIVWPAGGVERVKALQHQRPYTCYDALNVATRWGTDQRERGGARPGLRKRHFTELGSGAPVRCLTPLDVYATDDAVVWEDDFYALGSAWSAATWSGAGGSLPTVAAHRHYLHHPSPLLWREAVAAVLPISQAAGVACYIDLRILGAGTYRVFCRMDNTTPSPNTSGVVVEINFTSAGVYTGTIKSNGVTKADIVSGTNALWPKWLRIMVQDNQVSAWLEGSGISVAATVDAHAGQQRFGFGLTSAAKVCAIRVLYVSTDDAANSRRHVCAVANGTFYRSRDQDISNLQSHTGTLTLANDRNLEAVQHGQAVYIADYGPVLAEAADGVISGATLDSATYTDWTALGIEAANHVVVLEAGTGPTLGVYEIDSVAAGAITLTASPGDGTDITFRIERCPKKYTSSTNALTRWFGTTALPMPIGGTLICSWRSRIVVARRHIWYMSRLDDPDDWDYSQLATGDSASAIYGTSADATKPGPPITALMPASNDYLLVGCTDELWCLDGDPAFGGRMRCLDRNLGVIGPRAWCMAGPGLVYFMSRSGLCAVAPGASGGAVLLGKGRIPHDMTNLPETTVLVYDPTRNWVWIFSTSSNLASRPGWIFDPQTQGFWPISFGTSNAHPYAAMPFEGGVLLGCQDGYTRAFHEYAPDDDGSSYASWVKVGPFRVAEVDSMEGMLHTMRAAHVEGLTAGQVDWELYTGANPASVPDDTVADMSGIFYTDGRPQLVMRRAHSFVLKIGSLTDEQADWGFESISAVLRTTGPARTW